MAQHNLLSGNNSVVMLICSIHRAGQRCYVVTFMAKFLSGGGGGGGVECKVYIIDMYS